MIASENIKEICDFVCAKIKEILKDKEYVIMGFSGGRSIGQITDALKLIEVDWNKVHFFVVDERLVPLHHSDSNFRLLDRIFFGYLVNEKGVSKENFHPFILDKGVSSYNDEFLGLGGKFDIAIFGVGEDGHIGALFPNSKFDNNDLFFKIYNSPKPPKERMTLSKKNLQNSDLVVLLFVGDGKRNAFDNFNDESISVENCPAKLALRAKKVIVYSDFS